jgi:hypothetical protein
MAPPVERKKRRAAIRLPSGIISRLETLANELRIER